MKSRPYMNAENRIIVRPPDKAHGRGRGNDNDFFYSDDEREFMVAMERWKRANHKPHPDCRDVLKVLLSLGYRREPCGEDCDRSERNPG